MIPLASPATGFSDDQDVVVAAVVNPNTALHVSTSPTIPVQISGVQDELLSYVPADPSPEEFRETLRQRTVQFSGCSYIKQGATFWKFNCRSLGAATGVYALILLALCFLPMVLVHGPPNTNPTAGGFTWEGDGDVVLAPNTDDVVLTGCCVVGQDSVEQPCSVESAALGMLCSGDCFMCGACPVDLYPRGKAQCESCWGGVWLDGVSLNAQGQCSNSDVIVVPTGADTTPAVDTDTEDEDKDDFVFGALLVYRIIKDGDYCLLAELVGLALVHILATGFIITPMIASYYVAVFNAMRQNSLAKFCDFFRCRKNWCRLACLGLTMSLLVSLGTLCFILPGVLLAFGFSFAIPLLIEHPFLGVCGALCTSIRMVCRHLCGLIAFYFFTGCLNLLGSFAYGIPLLITIPLTFSMHAYCYHHLFVVNGVMITVPVNEVSTI